MFPTEGEGDIVFDADPVGLGVSVGSGVGISVSLLFTYLVNRWVDFNQICMDVTVIHNKELIRFW